MDFTEERKIRNKRKENIKKERIDRSGRIFETYAEQIVLTLIIIIRDQNIGKIINEYMRIQQLVFLTKQIISEITYNPKFSFIKPYNLNQYIQLNHSQKTTYQIYQAFIIIYISYHKSLFFLFYIFIFIMGIITTFKRKIDNCFEQSDQYQTNQTYFIINTDQKYIENQSWYRFRQKITFDYNIFIFMYHDYQVDQDQMQKNWSSIKFNLGDINFVRDSSQVISLKWKYAIRKGVPFSIYKIFASQLFHIKLSQIKQQDYNKNINLLFKGKVPDSFHQVPLFGIDADNIKMANKFQCLNNQGMKALSRLLWIINKTKSLQYTPHMVHVISFLLIIFEERQVYRIIEYMIDESLSLHIKNQQCLRWHFTVNQNQYSKLAQSCFEQIRQVSKTFAYLTQHLNKYKINKEQLFEQLTKDFFFGYLPFSFITKIFTIYLNEGVKIFFRIIYAMFKTWSAQIQKIDQLQKLKILFKEKGLMLSRNQINKMLKMGFSLALQKLYKNFNDYNHNLIQKNNFGMYYFPIMQGESQILNSEQLQIIWGYLPSIYKHYDAIKVFPADKYGYSATQLVECFKTYEGRGILIMLKTTNSAVFGAFFENNYNPKSQQFYFGTSDTFLICLLPQQKVYRPSGQNINFCRINQDKTLVFGSGGKGPALHITKQLRKGYSYKSQTYLNQNLNGSEASEFQIECLQCFVLE